MKNCRNDIEDLQFILKVIGGKWKLYILTSLYYNKKRFKELERDITGISPKMLIKELKDLESIGIVHRKTYNTVPITVEYSLTEEGLTLKPILEQMRNWARDFKESLAKGPVKQPV